MADKKKPKSHYRPDDKERKAIAEVNAAIEEGAGWHRAFAEKVERRYAAYRGMVEERSKGGWRSNVHQPLLINIVEGMLSAMEEAEPSWKVVPRVVPGMDVEDAIRAGDAAELAEYVLLDQMRSDDFAAKQGAFMQQDLIAGFSPGKIFWLQEPGLDRYYDERPQAEDAYGGSVDMANEVDRLDAFEVDVLLRDAPTFEVRDVRDFMYPESATSVDKAPWIIDRTFVHYSTLEKMEELGVYRNCEYVKETRADKEAVAEQTTRSGPDVVQERERRLRNADRTRGLVEIVEWWKDDRVVTVANRTVLLRDDANPLWHARKPFVTAAAIPDAFQIPGISVIEGLAAMQEMVWTLQNTRLDATRLLANPVTLIRGDADNAGDYEFAPLAQWFVTDPNQVKLLEVNPNLASLTMQAEQMLRGDIRDVMGGLPFTGTAESATVDQQTATGVSIITNIAQAILARRKRNHIRAFGRIGQHFLALSQQFLTDDRVITILGESGGRRYIEVNNRDLRGIFDVAVEFVGDSLMRQEKRAESGALLTQAMQGAQIMAQTGNPLNLKRFWEKHLEAYDVRDTPTYFSAPPAPQGQPAAAGGPPGTPPGAENLLEQMGGMGPGGVTNPELAAGPTSPSSPVSMSPMAAGQQALARNGQGRSV